MPRINQLESLKVFKAVVECGSFTQAAKRLNISAARVSKSIESLELELGTLLFNRSTRHMLITDSGEQCYNRAIELIHQWQELKEQLLETHQSPVGKLRISAPMTWGLLKLAPILNDFMDQYPDITLDVQLSDTQVNVLEGQYDLVLRITHQLDDSALICRKLTSYSMIACASPAYLKKFSQPLHPNELKNHATLIYAPPGTPRKWQFNEGRKRFEVLLNPLLLANNSKLLHLALLANKGIALVPEFIVSDDIQSGKLIAILQQFSSPNLNVYSLRPSDRTPSHRLKVLQEFLSQRLASGQ